MSLLDDIEKAALDPNVRVADALRKCIALGGQAGSVELRDWAAHELNGYNGDEELPNYRVIPAIIAMDVVTPRAMWRQRQIAPRNLPEGPRDVIKEEVPITYPIAEVEELAQRPNGESIKLSLPDAATICQVMNYDNSNPHQQIHALYWVTSPTAFRAMADQVRTKLTSIVAEIRATTPRGQQTPSAQAASQAVEVVIKGGKRHQINITTAQGEGSQATTFTGDGHGRLFWTAVSGLAAVVVATVAVLGLLLH